MNANLIQNKLIFVQYNLIINEIPWIITPDFEEIMVIVFFKVP